MALIKCPDCGKEVSDIAEACPNCGRPIKDEGIYESTLKCPNCGRQVFEITSNCPDCGTSLRRKLNKNQLLLDVSLAMLCPVCGDMYITSPLNNEKRIVTLENGNTDTEYHCQKCKNWVIPYRPKHHFVYYSEYSILTGKSANDEMLKEAKENPLFDEVEYSKRIQKEKGVNSHTATASLSSNQKAKCPTCGSTNIEKISTSSKVIGASLFGLFSKNATSQFKCKNCGYKW